MASLHPTCRFLFYRLFSFADKASSGSLEAEQDEAISVSRIARLVTLHFLRCHCHYQQATSEANVRFGSLADIRARNRDVRFTPKSGRA
jgi:hypothetical protein